MMNTIVVPHWPCSANQKISLHLSSSKCLSRLHNPRSMWRAYGHQHNHPISGCPPKWISGLQHLFVVDKQLMKLIEDQ